MRSLLNDGAMRLHENESLDFATPITSPTLVEDCGIAMSTHSPNPYSFTFDGYVQELDHALLTDVAAARCVIQYREHGNADVAEGGARDDGPVHGGAERRPRRLRRRAAARQLTTAHPARSC